MHRIGALSVIVLLGPGCDLMVHSESNLKPNIIIILADDLGVGDIQRHYPDNKILTPNLDRLVDEGMSFTDAHSSSAVCSPTRYGLLTGRYNWRTALQERALSVYDPPLIDEDRVTLPEILRVGGYVTACIGKWHLGWNWPGERPGERMNRPFALLDYEWDFEMPITGGPTKHGFDYFFGVDAPNFPPFTYLENDRIVELPTSTYRYDPDEVGIMPRVLHGAPKAPGWRFDRILPDITDKAVQYIHEQSKSDKPFFLYFAMTSPHEPISPSEKFRGKSGLAPVADFIMETDWSVGQLLKAVGDVGISENTLIIFTADNGHSHYTGHEKLAEVGHMPAGPFRGHKGQIWEGGHRVPFVAKWEGKIKPGSVSDQLICLTDIFATCHEMVTGKKLPPDQGEDSFSFLDVLLKENGRSERNNLVSHSLFGEFAYRKGKWKMVFILPENNLELSRGKAAKVELYNLESDIAEAHDSLEFYPVLAKDLKNELTMLVERGTSKNGEKQSNDVHVVFDAIQPAAWAKPGKHLFILSGQSNMRALDPDLSFKPALVKEFGKDQIIIVKDAQGGQPIRRWYRQWKSSQEDFPEFNGDLYDRLMTGVHEAVGDEHILSVTFVWMQGERDAREKNGDVYATSLRGLIDQLQTDLGREDMNFVIGRINDFAMDQPDWIMVREAQVEIAESNPRGAWVDTDDLNDGPDKQGRELINDLHMTPAGYRILGQRFAEKSIELIRKVH